MYSEQIPNLKQNIHTAQAPQINNRYQESDQIFIDPTLSDLRKNLLIQREQNQSYNPNTYTQRMTLQPSNTQSNTLNQKQNIVSQRNYIIYQPQTAFQQPEIPSEVASNISSQPNEENYQQISLNNEMNSFTNDTGIINKHKYQIAKY